MVQAHFVITSYSIHYTKLYDKLAVDSFYSVDDVARQNGEYDDKCFVNKVSTLSRLVKLAQENVGLKNMPQDELFVAIADKKYSNEIDYSEKAQICEYVEELSRHITIKTVITSYSIHYTKLYDYK